MSRINFSVIIPTYNDWERLRYCIDALEDQDFPKNEFEVIVVNNNRSGDLPARYNVPEFVKIYHEPEPGSYAARNRGAKVAKGEFLAFTDSDCIPETDWLKNAAHHFSEFGCELIGGKINLYREVGGSKLAYIYELHNAFRQDETVPNGNSVTANLFVRKSVFDGLGGFDAEMKSGGDWEFTKRAVFKGFLLDYSPTAAVKHPARSSLKKILLKQKRLAAWGYVNIKNKYGYSSLRIFLSNFKGSFRRVQAGMESNKKFKHRIVVTITECLITSYRLYLIIGISLKLIDPYKVRE